jgi:hypothetical protein
VTATATLDLLGCASWVPVENAIVGIDLADRKQMVVVTDHDSKVLARRTFAVSGPGIWVSRWTGRASAQRPKAGPG